MAFQLSKAFIETLVQFRKSLHQHPELSDQEQSTPRLILDFLGKQSTAKVFQNLGGNGLAIIYDSEAQGPTTLFRCELDALPIQESNTFAHKSKNEGIS